MPTYSLSLILLTDQFTRNIYRNTAKAFAGDGLAVNLCQQLMGRDYHTTAPIQVAAFTCMPLQHSESNTIQSLSLTAFEEILNSASNKGDKSVLQAKQYYRYANIHKDIIDRFGRFPHRNEVLKRQNTSEEESYLRSENMRFGQ